MNENIQKLFNNIVKISSPAGSGSGFYIKSSDIVVTNFHVISGVKSLAIETYNKEKIKAHVLQINPMTDIALLRPAKSISDVELIVARNASIKNMDEVFILGYPFGMPFSVTEGIISSPKQFIEGKYYIQTDAAINPGNSGGPMINKNGEVIGINTCKLKEADNMGFAIPSDTIGEELDSLKNNKIEKFGVKCPSCSFLITEKQEYCENCGSKLDVDKLFEELKLSPLAELIEETIQKAGIDPILARAGYEFWEFYRGSALLRFFVFKGNYFFATCPLVKIPKINPINVYNYILSNSISPYILGISEGIIYLSYRICIPDIFSDFKEIIKSNLIGFTSMADKIDNLLVDTYDCELSDLSKKE